jgi:hypothetical protein
LDFHFIHGDTDGSEPAPEKVQRDFAAEPFARTFQPQHFSRNIDIPASVAYAESVVRDASPPLSVADV